MPTLKEILGDEILGYFLAIGWFIFMGINVNTTLGLIYYGFPTTAILLSIFDRQKSIKYDKDGEWIKGVFIGTVVYVIFIVLSLFLIPIYAKLNIGGLIKLLGASAPILAQSKILNFITFWLPVAFVETMSVIRFMDFIASKFNIRLDKQSLFTLPVLILIFAFSFGMMILHSTAKNLENVALMLVFTMFFISLAISVWYEEGKQAVIFHMISNGIAGLVTFFGIILFGG